MGKVQKKELKKDLHDYGCSSGLPKDDKRLKLFKRQRKERGFDDTETWNLDLTIIRFLAPRLKRFAEVTQTYPSNFSSYKEWKKQLNRAAKRFEKYAYCENRFEMTQREMDLFTSSLRLIFDNFQSLWW